MTVLVGRGALAPTGLTVTVCRRGLNGPAWAFLALKSGSLAGRCCGYFLCFAETWLAVSEGSVETRSLACQHVACCDLKFVHSVRRRAR